MNEYIKIGLMFLSDPNVMSFIAGSALTILASIKKYKESKDKHIFDLIVDIAKEEAIKLVELNLNNEEKRKVAIKNIYKKLPKQYQYISEEFVNKALTLAYQFYVKNDINKENIDA